MDKRRGDGVPFQAVRRSDRAITDVEWVARFLDRATSGVLAMAEGNQPHMNVNTYVYDHLSRMIYLHTAGRGATRERIEANENVTFLVHQIGEFLPAEEAAEFSVEYASVIVYGKAFIVSDDEIARRALNLLLEKYFPEHEPEEDYRPITDRELDRTTVIGVKIDSWSGKMKKASEGVPGAFKREPLALEHLVRT